MKHDIVTPLPESDRVESRLANNLPCPGRRLRVLQVTPRFFPFMGGVETHVYQVSRRLVNAGMDITVLTTDLSGKWPKSELIEGIKVERVRAWPPHRDYYWAPGIYKKIRTGDWDLIHLQSYHTFVAPLAMLAAERSKIPFVVTFHGGGHSSRLRNAMRGVQRALLRPMLVRSQRLVAVAQFEIKQYSRELRLPENKFCLIPNGADLPQPPTTSSFKSPNGTLIASIGRLERYKGHQRIIAALPKLIDIIPDVHLWIAGTGPYETELKNLAQKLGVTDRVTIQAIPLENRDAMAEAISKTALVVLLSEYETHPIAVLEALALRKPVLVTDSSGTAELARKGLARAIPLKSTPEEVATAIYEQITHPIIPGEFHLPTWEECATRLQQLYKLVLQEGSCAS